MRHVLFILSFFAALPSYSQHHIFNTIGKPRLTGLINETHCIDSVPSFIENVSDSIGNSNLYKIQEISLSNKRDGTNQREYNNLNLANLYLEMEKVGLSNKFYVLAQAILETGFFTSNVCHNYNNLFGLYDSHKKDYYRFNNWQESVSAYRKYIQYRYKGGNYLIFLKRIGYAEDPLYTVKVEKIYREIINYLIKKTE